MTSTVHEISRSLDIVYLDFQKAFEKVPHKKLMFKVTVVGKVHNWIKNCLNNRKQRVVINGSAQIGHQSLGASQRDLFSDQYYS